MHSYGVPQLPSLSRTINSRSILAKTHYSIVQSLPVDPSSYTQESRPPPSVDSSFQNDASFARPRSASILEPLPSPLVKSPFPHDNSLSGVDQDIDLAELFGENGTITRRMNASALTSKATPVGPSASTTITPTVVPVNHQQENAWPVKRDKLYTARDEPEEWQSQNSETSRFGCYGSCGNASW
jgi:hypothetical protein